MNLRRKSVGIGFIVRIVGGWKQPIRITLSHPSVVKEVTKFYRKFGKSKVKLIHNSDKFPFKLGRYTRTIVPHSRRKIYYGFRLHHWQNISLKPKGLSVQLTSTGGWGPALYSIQIIRNKKRLSIKTRSPTTRRGQ